MKFDVMHRARRAAKGGQFTIGQRAPFRFLAFQKAKKWKGALNPIANWPHFAAQCARCSNEC